MKILFRCLAVVRSLKGTGTPETATQDKPADTGQDRTLSDYSIALRICKGRNVRSLPDSNRTPCPVIPKKTEPSPDRFLTPIDPEMAPFVAMVQQVFPGAEVVANYDLPVWDPDRPQPRLALGESWADGLAPMDYAEQERLAIQEEGLLQ